MPRAAKAALCMGGLTLWLTGQPISPTMEVLPVNESTDMELDLV
jgi:hypothetical protein